MKISKLLFISFCCFAQSIFAQVNITAKSPNKKLHFNFDTQQHLLSIFYDGQSVLKATIDLQLKNNPSFKNVSFKTLNKRIVKENLTDFIPTKERDQSYTYQKVVLDYGLYLLELRLYNHTIAYRFVTRINEEITVMNEQMAIKLPPDTQVEFPKEDSMYSHYERYYLSKKITDIKKGDFCSLPVLFTTSKVLVWFSEADVYDYPGMFLQADGIGFKTKFPKVPSKISDKNDRDENIVSTYPYIAKTDGKRNLPWRVFVLTKDDRLLLSDTSIFKLSREGRQKMDWVIPGKVAWDWYNANNIYGVDFKSGINTKTYKYYVDFASKNNLPYIILDEGWSKSTTDIKVPNADIDLKHLINYAQKKGVGVILWVLWKPLSKDIEGILARYKKWGVKGVKVDFMQRADQKMVRFYQAVAKIAAKYQLVVDFHGAFKPSGLRRAYPNILSYEGLKGAENNKWSLGITPQHNLTLPFIRMVSGPMDYTLGSMRNAHFLQGKRDVNNRDMNNYHISFYRPVAQGTRCHQLAMYVVYESPLQMLSDTPSSYMQEPIIESFISKIPTVWDKTYVLEAKLKAYLVMVRKNKNRWYVGGMSALKEKITTVDFSFLPKGNYHLEMIQDGVNSNTYAEDYKKIERSITNEDSMTVKMNRAGGFVMIITKK